MQDLGIAIAVVILPVGHCSWIVGSDPDAAAVTPNGLGICSGCGFCFRTLHISDLLVRGAIDGMRDIVRRTTARSGPEENKSFDSKRGRPIGKVCSEMFALWIRPIAEFKEKISQSSSIQDSAIGRIRIANIPNIHFLLD